MSDAIYTAATGAAAQQMRMELLANNLANVDTVGFKEDGVVFRAFLPGQAPAGTQAVAPVALPPAGRPLPSNYHTSMGEAQTRFAQGALKPTGNPLDVGLEGEGFFVVQAADGPRYTRKGSFQLDGEGTLVTGDGLPVLGDGGPIRIEPEGARVTIDEEGNVFADDAQVGTLRLANFDAPYPLRKVGDTLFILKDPLTPEKAIDGLSVHQGHVEVSNVEAVRALTEMIEVMRLYEACQKMMRTADESTGRVINDVGRLG
jgi:flagellar basal-body rod protein FlgG